MCPTAPCSSSCPSLGCSRPSRTRSCLNGPMAWSVQLPRQLRKRRSLRTAARPGRPRQSSMLRPALRRAAQPSSARCVFPPSCAYVPSRISRDTPWNQLCSIVMYSRSTSLTLVRSRRSLLGTCDPISSHQPAADVVSAMGWRHMGRQVDSALHGGQRHACHRGCPKMLMRQLVLGPVRLPAGLSSRIQMWCRDLQVGWGARDPDGGGQEV